MVMPTHTAVTGSMAPNTDVSVEFMFLMVRTSARLDTVGTNASITSDCLMWCGGPNGLQSYAGSFCPYEQQDTAE